MRRKSRLPSISSKESAEFLSFYEIIPRNVSIIIPLQYCAHLTLLVEKSQALSLSYHTITIIRMPNLAGSSNNTCHSAYVATETKLYGAKIDGLLPPNFL